MSGKIYLANNKLDQVYKLILPLIIVFRLIFLKLLCFKFFKLGSRGGRREFLLIKQGRMRVEKEKRASVSCMLNNKNVRCTWKVQISNNRTI
jgi:hypothetical protein